jgi:hypothetical protein
MRLGYVEEKLTAVVLELSQGEGSIQENLANCAIFLLQLKPEDFPPELSKTFAFIKRMVTEGEAEAVRQMSRNEASHLVDELVSLFKEVIRERARLVN